MPDDYFPMAGPDEGAEAPPAESAAPGEKPEGEGEEGATALIPKSVLGGKEFEPGQEVVLKVVRVHGDQVEVSYASETPETPSGPNADQEIDEMAGASKGGY